MPFCIVCNKDYISEDLTTIGNQSVCCLSCVGLLKANNNDACSYCGRPVWKDEYYEIDKKFFCSEKCKNITQKSLIKKKGVKYVKCRHFKEEKYYNESPKNKKFEKEEKMSEDENISNDSMENNEWNKKSFIQKESYDDEHNSGKENENIKWNKIIQEEKIKENKKHNNTQHIKKKKKENMDKHDKRDNIIKNMKKYFQDTKDSIQKMKYEKKIKNNRITENKIINHEFNKFPKQSIPKISNLSLNPINKYNNYLTNNNYNFIEINPFDTNNDINKKKRNLSIGKNENNLNVIKENQYVFNPIRKSHKSKSIKKCSYPTDSLTFPTDTLPSKNEFNKDLSINCCHYCQKPIIIRDSNVFKEFCSILCKNQYYKDVKK